jgi:ankyrin repeat protein
MQGQTPLLYAAQCGYRHSVQELLLTRRVDLVSRDSSGYTPLIWAARRGSQYIVRDLLTRHGKSAANDRELLLVDRLTEASPIVPHSRVASRKAAQFGSINIMDRYQRTALSYAAQIGSSKCVWELLELGADPTLADYMGETPLMYAAISCSAKTVQQFYHYPDFFDNKDVEGRTALSYAAEFGTLAMIQIFLRDQRIDPDSRDKKNRSPLSYAAQYGTLDIVNALLADSQVDADSKCSGGLSPLSWAFERKVSIRVEDTTSTSKEEDTQRSIVRAFLRTGRVDINSRDNLGQTALLRAARHQRYSIAAILLNYGCDIHIQDDGRMTALDWAQCSGNEKIIQLLREYTPDTNGKKIYTSYGHLSHRFND